jgi:8-oxo-dGTP pyrophosphatase MutT (NUDIX family)
VTAVRTVDREAARLLVLAPTDRALLLRLEPDFRDPFWVTPGGGLDEGESFEQAAARELREEVGRDDLVIGLALWDREVVFTWEDWYVSQLERTFLVRAPEEFEPVTLEPGIEPITGGRWLSVEEIRSLREDSYPENLPALVETLLRDGPPAAPMRADLV